MRHPSREELLAYAESLVDRNAPVSSALAAHVTACKRCSAEVRDIRKSLDFTASAEALEPSRDLTSQILLAAQDKKRPARRIRVPAVARKLGFLAAFAMLFLAGAFWFGLVLAPPAEPPPALSSAADQGMASMPHASGPARRARDAEILRLSTALNAAHEDRQHPAERRLRQIVAAAAEDAAIARDALRRNPGSPRARETLDYALELQVAALRALYLGQAQPGRERDKPETTAPQASR